MTLIEETKAQELYEITTNKIQKSGGSVANSLACVSQLGGKTARFTNEYTEYALHNIDLW